jgi:hypothetical protein
VHQGGGVQEEQANRQSGVVFTMATNAAEQRAFLQREREVCVLYGSCCATTGASTLLFDTATSREITKK